jgi:tetratricopeptide (TPR) repeat protein
MFQIYVLVKKYQTAMFVCIAFMCVSGAGANKSGVSTEIGVLSQETERARLAFVADSMSPEAVLDYAAVLVDGKTVLILLERVWNSTRATDSQKSRAAELLGEAAYVTGNYNGSAEWYQKSMTADTLSPFKWQAVRAAIAAGKYESAEAIINNAPPDAMSSQHYGYYLGVIFMYKKKFERAFECFRAAAGITDAGYSIAALNAAIEALDSMGDVRRSRQYKEMLEKRGVQSVLTAGAFLPSAEQPKTVSAEKKQEPLAVKNTASYTLQIGAFASYENAERMFNSVKGKFPDTEITTEMLNGKSLHKVKIGRFRTENEALAFGNGRLKNENITFRVSRE